MAIKITVEVTCSMCGNLNKNFSEQGAKPPLEINFEYADELNPKTITKLIKRAGWIVQFNGDNMDTYCTKACAA